jgi:uncharacterized protein
MSEHASRLRSSYAFDGPLVELGHAIVDGAPDGALPIRLPIAMTNRHGLIAGATGTGKTRTLQLIVEQLSAAGVPTFVADVKGDLSGLATPGPASQRVVDRMASVGRSFAPAAFPVEFFSLRGTRGTQLRATVSSFGPLLLAKVLDLTETQQSVLAMVFKYCDDHGLALLDFKDLREILLWLSDAGKEEGKRYGGMSPATVGVLLRKMVELEQQGAEVFFGEPELDVNDLMRTDLSGRGVVNVLSLSDMQDRPRLFSTFLMWLLSRLYYDLPEVGDAALPKLVFFFDEAHLLFDDASPALSRQIEQVVRLIRSKGVGVFFITQTPRDVKENVLAQLGHRVQHALRAFTPKDAKDVKATAATFPPTSFFQVERSLTSLGTGEALVTVLSPKGIPSETAQVQILAPSSSMSPLPEEEMSEMIRRSYLRPKYATPIDRESAHEILSRRMAESQVPADEAFAMPVPAPARGGTAKREAKPRAAAREKSIVGDVMANAARQAARSITREIVRGLFGTLGRRR